MNEYVYENQNGDRRSIHARMTEVPPESVTFNEKGHWSPVPANDPLAWKRVYGDCEVRMGRSFPYVSKRNARAPVARDETCEQVEVEVGSQHRHKVKCPVIKSAEHERYLAKKYGLEIE